MRLRLAITSMTLLGGCPPAATRPSNPPVDVTPPSIETVQTAREPVRMGSPWLSNAVSERLSLDGSTLLVSDSDGGLVVVDGPSHTVRRRLANDSEELGVGLAVSNTGHWGWTAITGASRLWDLEDGSIVATMTEHCQNVASGDAHFVCVTYGWTAVVVELPSGMRQPVGRQGARITTAGISPSGEIIALAVHRPDASDEVEVWRGGHLASRLDLDSVRPASSQPAYVRTLAVGDAGLVAVLTAEGAVVGFEADTSKVRISDWTPPMGESVVVAIDPADGSMWAPHGYDLRRWDADGSGRVMADGVHSVYGIGFRGRDVAILDAQQVRVFSKSNGVERAQPGLSAAEVGSLFVDSKRARVRAVDREYRRSVTWDLHRGTAIEVETANDCRGFSLARGPHAAAFEAAWRTDPALVATACASMAEVGVDGWIGTLAIAEDRFVRVGEGGRSTIHSAADGAVLAQIEPFGVGATMDATSDGKWLVYTAYSEGLTLVDGRTGAVERTFAAPPASFRDVAIDRTDTWVVTTNGEGHLGIWTLADGTPTFHEELGRIIAMARSPDADEIALGFDDGFIERRHVPSGALIQRWRGHDDDVIALEYGEGTALVSASLDGTLVAWPANGP